MYVCPVKAFSGVYKIRVFLPRLFPFKLKTALNEIEKMPSIQILDIRLSNKEFETLQLKTTNSSHGTIDK